MKRTKYNIQHKREKMKNEIIQAAVSLFMKKGFDRVSLSDISSKINRGRTTVYEYFKNKNEILAQYLEEEMLRYHEKVIDIMGRNIGFKDKLMEFVSLQLEYGIHHGGFSQLFRSLSRVSRDISEKTEIVIREKHREVYRVLTNEFSLAIKRKDIRDMPPELVMQLLINATSLPVRSKKDQARTAEEVLSIFWSGISNADVQVGRK